ncbi:MAG: hypothetical protein OEY23_23935 [Acidimicrobiia bacterium]|nr:hypothetical protein [Acidimicrobiia bacterium]
MAPDELLERIAATLRADIGPAIDEPYPKTQAFMAAVVLERVARQVRTANAHEAAARAEQAALLADLGGLVPADSPVAALLADAPAPGAPTADAKTWQARLVSALWANADSLGADLFERILGRVRVTLRHQVDREVEVAR